MAKGIIIIYFLERVGLDLSFSVRSYSEQQIDPQLLEMKTSPFIIVYPRIENRSIGK